MGDQISVLALWSKLQRIGQIGLNQIARFGDHCAFWQWVGAK
jgi:hypothetical protein